MPRDPHCQAYIFHHHEAMKPRPTILKSTPTPTIMTRPQHGLASIDEAKATPPTYIPFLSHKANHSLRGTDEVKASHQIWHRDKADTTRRPGIDKAKPPPTHLTKPTRPAIFFVRRRGADANLIMAPSDVAPNSFGSLPHSFVLAWNWTILTPF